VQTATLAAAIRRVWLEHLERWKFAGMEWDTISASQLGTKLRVTPIPKQIEEERSDEMELGMPQDL